MRRFHSFFYDGLFVVLIMAAAMASAVLEASVVLGAFPAIDAGPRAGAASSEASRPASTASSVDASFLSAAVLRPAGALSR